MSLSPIQMFQNNGQNSITSLLQGGPNAVARIMDQAIQIGRQMSDKQLAQERDMMAMRQQETDLQQRRAENTQQGIESSIRFARSAFESDRRHAYDQQNQQFSQNRTYAQDMFSNNMDERKMRLTEAEFSAEEEARKRAEQERVNAQELFDLQNNPNRTVAPASVPTQAAVIPPTEVTPETRVKNDMAEILNRGASNPETMKGRPAPENAQTQTASQLLAPPSSTQPAPVNTRDLSIRIAELEKQEKNANLRPDQQSILVAQRAGLEDDLRRLQVKEKADAKGSTGFKLDPLEKERAETYVVDREAFPPQMVSLDKKYAGKNADFAKLKTDEERSKWLSENAPDEFREATAFDKDRIQSEVNSALAASSREAYVANTWDKSAKAVKLRGALYDYAKKYFDAGGDGSSSTTGSIWDQVPR
jgi:hypothetical protein